MMQTKWTADEEASRHGSRALADGFGPTLDADHQQPHLSCWGSSPAMMSSSGAGMDRRPLLAAALQAAAARAEAAARRVSMALKGQRGGRSAGCVQVLSGAALSEAARRPLTFGQAGLTLSVKAQLD
ncbi:hypothetical protein ABPG75_008276 [Micractinium tetrahymenae]